MKRDVALYVEDIVGSIKLIEEYTKDLFQDQLRENIVTQDAVIRRIEIIDEGVNSIQNEFKEKQFQIP